MGTSSANASNRNLALAVITVLVIGLSMRAPIVSVSPILLQLQAAYGLSSVAASLLTTLPVLCFGLLALIAPRLERRFGMERTILAMLLLTTCGMLVRALDGPAGLFTGTVILGAAIAVNNVLLPGLVKRDWSHLAGPLMSVYSVSMSLGPTLAAVLTVPLLQLLDGNTRLTLLSWVFTPLAGLFLLLLLKRRMAPAAGGAGTRIPSAGNLLRDPLAWQVSVYLGLQSLLFYAITAWLPTILASSGLPALTAGLGFSVFNLVSIAGSLAGPLLAARLRHQGAIALIGALLWLVGLGGLLLAAADAMYLWVTVAGFGSGLSFSLALTLLVLRAGDASQAARLSGMAQAIGYMLAAAGPLLLGWLFETSGSWRVPLLFLLAVVPLLAAAGLGGGRPLTVLDGTNVTATAPKGRNT